MSSPSCGACGGNGWQSHTVYMDSNGCYPDYSQPSCTEANEGATFMDGIWERWEPSQCGNAPDAGQVYECVCP